MKQFPKLGYRQIAVRLHPETEPTKYAFQTIDIRIRSLPVRHAGYRIEVRLVDNHSSTPGWIVHPVYHRLDCIPMAGPAGRGV